MAPANAAAPRPYVTAVRATSLRSSAELAEPAGQHRPQPATGRHPQEAVALAELAVLVAAAGHERLVETAARDVERHDVQMVIRVDQQRAPCCAQAAATASRPGTISAVSKSTDETITHARAIVHRAREPLGQRLRRPAPRDRDDRRALLRSRSSWRRMVWNSPSVVTSVGRCARAAARTASASTSSWVFWPSAMSPANRPGSRAKPVAHFAACASAAPTFVHELRGVEPRALLRLERHVGPRLMRVAGEQQPFGDAEARVVRARSQRGPSTAWSQLRANLPQVRKDRLARASSRR